MRQLSHHSNRPGRARSSLKQLQQHSRTRPLRTISHPERAGGPASSPLPAAPGPTAQHRRELPPQLETPVLPGKGRRASDWLRSLPGHRVGLLPSRPSQRPQRGRGTKEGEGWCVGHARRGSDWGRWWPARWRTPAVSTSNEISGQHTCRGGPQIPPWIRPSEVPATCMLPTLPHQKPPQVSAATSVFPLSLKTEVQSQNTGAPMPIVSSYTR